MGIGIETNLSLICTAFNISYAKITGDYKGMSINQIMEQEAAQGNDLALKFDEELLSNPEKLVEFIQLNNPSNKFAILSNMNENDLSEMLPLLQSEDMALGLNFFTQDKLLKMISQLPNEDAANLSLQMFSPEHLMYLMPKEAINAVLDSRELKGMEGLEHDCVRMLPPEILAQMIEATTGQIPEGFKGIDMAGNASFDKEMLMKEINGFDKDMFQESLLAIPPEHKKLFMTQMVTEEPKIWTLFDSQYFAGAIAARKQKEDIVDNAAVINHKCLVGMNAELPKELMAVVLTQIDPKEFAEILQKNFRDVLGELAVS